MKDTIVTAQNKLLMMYPWVRNIDVSVLKKFMDTESRMIIQEASLDDDASVELIKLLQEKDVQIRTMPHVHTVAVVLMRPTVSSYPRIPSTKATKWESSTRTKKIH